MARKKRPSTTETRVMIIKLPPDVRAWIEKESEHALTPMNAEVVRSIRERMDREARSQRVRESERA